MSGPTLQVGFFLFCFFVRNCRLSFAREPQIETRLFSTEAAISSNWKKNFSIWTDLFCCLRSNNRDFGDLRRSENFFREKSLIKTSKHNIMMIERSLPTPEIRGSNQATGKIVLNTVYPCTWLIRKDFRKIDGKEAGNGPLKKGFGAVTSQTGTTDRSSWGPAKSVMIPWTPPSLKL